MKECIYRVRSKITLRYPAVVRLFEAAAHCMCLMSIHSVTSLLTLGQAAAEMQCSADAFSGFCAEHPLLPVRGGCGRGL